MAVGCLTSRTIFCDSGMQALYGLAKLHVLLHFFVLPGFGDIMLAVSVRVASLCTVRLWFFMLVVFVRYVMFCTPGGAYFGQAGPDKRSGWPTLSAIFRSGLGSGLQGQVPVVHVCARGGLSSACVLIM